MLFINITLAYMFISVTAARLPPAV